MTTEDEDGEELRPSKSQRKRDMQALREMAERLVELSSEQLASLPDTDIIEAADQAQRITKGNAKKRQIQHLTRLLSRSDITAAKALIDMLDASSATHVQKFHRLETWRERLIDKDAAVMNEILAEYPDLDRQQLHQLVRNAQRESEKGEERAAYRKLFQFLKSLLAQ